MSSPGRKRLRALRAHFGLLCLEEHRYHAGLPGRHSLTDHARPGGLYPPFR